MTERDFLTQKDIQDDIGVTRKTLWNWRQKGKGPPWEEVCGRIIYDRDSYEKWKRDEYTVANGYRPSR